jgi:hypothetical protein
VRRLWIPSQIKGLYSNYQADLLEAVFEPNSSFERLKKGALSATKIVSIHLPASLERLGSTSLAFNERLELVAFEPGSRCRKIGAGAFMSTHIGFLSIPPSVQALGSECFCGCTGLWNVSISPDGILNTLGDRVFMASALESFSAPQSLSQLGDGCFSSCTSLEFVDFPTECQISKLPNGTFSGDNHLRRCILPASVEEVGQNCFLGCDLVLVDWAHSNSLGLISDGAFRVGKVIQLTIPQTVRTVGASAFADCCHLSELYFENGNLRLRIHEKAFIGTALTKVAFPSRLFSIGENCFYKCTTLKEASFPSGSFLRSIEKGAFTGSGLRAFNLPWSVSFLGEKCFKNCRNLREFTFDTGVELHTFPKELFAKSGIQFMEIPHGVEIIEQGCFRDCYDLWRLYLPRSTRRIEADAFSGVHSGIVLSPSIEEFSRACFGTESAMRKYCSGWGYLLAMEREFPDTVRMHPGDDSMMTGDLVRRTGAKTLIIDTSIHSIDQNAFKKSPHLENLIISDEASIYEFGESSFADSGLRTLDLGSVIQSIPSYAFQRNTYLSSITIPSSVKLIGKKAFANCCSLSSLEFQEPSQLETIELGAFSFTHLPEVTFPSSLTSIQVDGFRGNSEMRRVVFHPNSRVYLESGAFSDTNLDFVYLPPYGVSDFLGVGPNKHGVDIEVIRMRPRRAAEL